MEFNKAVKERRLRFANYHCEHCGLSLRNATGRMINFHHVIPKKFNGKGDFDNCVVLCPNCHGLIHSYQDSDSISKFTRFWNPYLGKISAVNGKFSYSQETDVYRARSFEHRMYLRYNPLPRQLRYPAISNIKIRRQNVIPNKIENKIKLYFTAGMGAVIFANIISYSGGNYNFSLEWSILIFIMATFVCLTLDINDKLHKKRVN